MLLCICAPFFSSIFVQLHGHWKIQFNLYLVLAPHSQTELQNGATSFNSFCPVDLLLKHPVLLRPHSRNEFPIYFLDRCAVRLQLLYSYTAFETLSSSGHVNNSYFTSVILHQKLLCTVARSLKHPVLVRSHFCNATSIQLFHLYSFRMRLLSIAKKPFSCFRQQSGISRRESPMFEPVGQTLRVYSHGKHNVHLFHDDVHYSLFLNHLEFHVLSRTDVRSPNHFFRLFADQSTSRKEIDDCDLEPAVNCEVDEIMPLESVVHCEVSPTSKSTGFQFVFIDVFLNFQNSRPIIFIRRQTVLHNFVKRFTINNVPN